MLNVRFFLLFILVFTCNYSYCIDEAISYRWCDIFVNSKTVESSQCDSLNQAKQKPLTLLRSQTEPLSFILYNQNTSKIKIMKIEVIDASRDNIDYDFRVVKKWYMGNPNTLIPTLHDLSSPKLVAELLLKNDNLVISSESTHRNYLQIKEESNVVRYQDISSPNILMPNNAVVEDASELKPFEINAGSNKQIWLNISTNKKTIAKQYAQKIKISYLINGISHVFIIPFSFEVLPVVLSNSKLNYAIYYTGQLSNKNQLLHFIKTEQEYVSELKNIHEHGIMYPTQYLSIMDSESVITFYVKTRAALNFPCDKFYFVGGIGNAFGFVESEYEKNIANLKRIITSNTKCSTPEIYLYGKDEAFGSILMQESKDWQYVNKHQAKVFASYDRSHVELESSILYLDTLIVVPSMDFDINLVSKNINIYAYGFLQSGIVNPFIYRNNYGFYLVQHNYDGAMPFAYQFVFPGYAKIGDLSNGLCRNDKTSYCSAWNNFDSSQYYDHMFTYPTSNGVIDTIQWEGYRAAINDVRYYDTLLDLIKDRCVKKNKNCELNPYLLIKQNDPEVTRFLIIDRIKQLIK